jgi:predicted GNAT family acetyltransferase
MSEQKLRNEVQRAEHAERLLKDTLLNEVLSSLEETLYHNIKTSTYKQVDEREECYRMLRVVESFRGQFESLIRNGKVARSRLDELLNKIKR